MLSFKLLPNGAEALKQYCKNHQTIFEVREKGKGNYIVRASNKNWINHLFRLGILIYVNKDKDTGEFYCLPTSNLNYELLVEELIEFWAFIDKIINKKEEKIDLRLFRD